MSNGQEDIGAARDRFVEDLLGYMTLEEKIGQLVLTRPDYGATGLGSRREDEELADRLRAGAVSAIAGAMRPDRAERLRRIAIEESRLGIPVMFAADTATGRETVMPVPASLAASWDMDAIAAGEEVIAGEARAAGIQWSFAPQLRRLSYRSDEDFAQGTGESALLAARVALARIRGLQHGDMTAPEAVMACLSVSGGNGDNGEDSALQVVLQALAEGVASTALGPSLQRALARLDTADPQIVAARANLLAPVQLGEWAEFARLAGAQPANPPWFNLPVARVAASVRDGRIALARIDDAARAMLAAKHRLGLFSGEFAPSSGNAAKVPMPFAADRRTAARELAQRSVILLRNTPALLPLAPADGDILVVGSAAADRRLPLHGRPGEAASLLDGLEAAGIAFRHAPGMALRQGEEKGDFGLVDADRLAIGMAGEAARRAHTVLVVLGDTPRGMNAGMLGQAQQRLLDTLGAATTRLVLVTLGERPVDPLANGEPLPAVVHGGKLGTMSGHALADVLLGRVAPTGALPYAVQARGSERRLPFGHGLTYTDFAFGRVHAESGLDCIRIGGELRNTGEREGAAVIQVYVRRLDSDAGEQLRDYQRVAVVAGARREVTFTLGAAAFAVLAGDGTTSVEPGRYALRIGLDADRAIACEMDIGAALAHAMVAGARRGAGRSAAGA